MIAARDAATTVRYFILVRGSEEANLEWVFLIEVR
jgi:hypothetical protein